MKSRKTAIRVCTQIQNLVFVISLQIVNTNTNLKEYKKFNDLLTQMLKCKTYNKKYQKNKKTNKNQEQKK